MVKKIPKTEIMREQKKVENPKNPRTIPIARNSKMKSGADSFGFLGNQALDVWWVDFGTEQAICWACSS